MDPSLTIALPARNSNNYSLDKMGPSFGYPSNVMEFQGARGTMGCNEPPNPMHVEIRPDPIMDLLSVNINNVHDMEYHGFQPGYPKRHAYSKMPTLRVPITYGNSEHPMMGNPPLVNSVHNFMGSRPVYSKKNSDLQEQIDKLQKLEHDPHSKKDLDSCRSAATPTQDEASKQKSDKRRCSMWQFCGYKKRPRATYEQLSVLERTFKINSLPDAEVREALSRQLNMKVRSIRIWFQNRRAKEKLSQKRAAQKLATENGASDQENAQQNQVFRMAQQRYPVQQNCGVYVPRQLGSHPQHAQEACYNMCFNPPKPQELNCQVERGAAVQVVTCHLIMSADFSIVGNWNTSNSQTSEVFLGLDFTENVLQLHIIKPDCAYKLISRVDTLVSMHFVRLDQVSAQVIVNLSSPPEIYTSFGNSSSRSGEFPFREDSGNLQEITKYVLCGKFHEMRAALMEFAKYNAHIRSVTFTDLESEKLYQTRPGDCIFTQQNQAYVQAPARGTSGIPNIYNRLIAESNALHQPRQQPHNANGVDHMSEFDKLELQSKNVLVR